MIFLLVSLQLNWFQLSQKKHPIWTRFLNDMCPTSVVHAYAYAYVCICMHMYVYACMHTCMHACMHACKHSCMHFAYVCMQAFICMYAYAYVHEVSSPASTRACCERVARLRAKGALHGMRQEGMRQEDVCLLRGSRARGVPNRYGRYHPR